MLHPSQRVFTNIHHQVRPPTSPILPSTYTFLPKTFIAKFQQWLEEKENLLVESRREARSESMAARSNRVTPARLVSRLVMRNPFSAILKFCGGSLGYLGALDTVDKGWCMTPPSRVIHSQQQTLHISIAIVSKGLQPKVSKRVVSRLCNSSRSRYTPCDSTTQHICSSWR